MEAEADFKRHESILRVTEMVCFLPVKVVIHCMHMLKFADL